MKFDCGETPQERRARIESWQPHFCILPRKVADHDCRWLEWIERKGAISYWWDGEDIAYQYRAIPTGT